MNADWLGLNGLLQINDVKTRKIELFYRLLQGQS